MATEEIPEDVRSFLLEHIESYEQLDVLVLLRRRPDESFSIGAISGSMNVPDAVIERALQDLHASGLIESSLGRGGPRYRYRSGDAATDAIIDGLAKAYAERPVDIVKLMSEGAIERVRTSAMRAFANAFVLGKSKKDG